MCEQTSDVLVLYNLYKSLWPIFLKTQYNVIIRGKLYTYTLQQAHWEAKHRGRELLRFWEHEEDQSPCRTHERNMPDLVRRIN